MFFILNNNYQLTLSAHKVKSMLGISCYKNINQIETDFKNISKSIQGMTLLKGLIKENDNKYYSAIFAEIFVNELIYCLHNIEFIKLNIESYCKKNINELNTNKYDETLPLTNKDILLISNNLEHNALIGINILYQRFIHFLKKLGFEISVDTYLRYDITLHFYNRFIISIVSALSNNPSQTHGQFIGDFEELYNISQNVWNMMSMLIYTDVFPFMIENNYEKHNYNDMVKKKNKTLFKLKWEKMQFLICYFKHYIVLKTYVFIIPFP